MDSFWHGCSAGASVSGTTYNFPSSSRSDTWGTVELSTSDGGIRVVPLTEDAEITGLYVWVDTAPGASKSWTFTFRDDQVDTAAVAVISGASGLSASWTGSIRVAAGSKVCLKCVPASTPAGAVTMRWFVTYRTAGPFYLMVGGVDSSTTLGGSTQYSSLSGGSNAAITSTESARQQVMPHAGTITKIAATTDRSPYSTSQGNTISARKNATTDSDGCAIIQPVAGTLVQSITPFTFSAGDLMSTKIAPTAAASSSRFGWCYTVYPAIPGDTAVMFGDGGAVSTTATNYESSPGIGGNGAWATTETNVNTKLPGGTMKSLYVSLATATGASKSRAFTVRSNNTDTALVATATNSATATDTTHTVLHGDGNFHSIKMVPTSTPAASSGARVSFVLNVPQGGNTNFFQWLR